MPQMIGSGLSRREREILDVLHRLTKASVGEVQVALPEAPSYSAVRTLLRILEEKGHVTHQEDGRRYVYVATEPLGQAAATALQKVVETFFHGSAEQAVYALVSWEEPDSEQTFEQRWEQMTQAVRALHQEQARKQERDHRAAVIKNLFEQLRDAAQIPPLRLQASPTPNASATDAAADTSAASETQP